MIGSDIMKIIIFILFISMFFSSCNFKREKKQSIFENNTFIIQLNDSASYKGRLSEKSFKVIDSVTKSSFITNYENFNGTETIWNIDVIDKGKITLYFSSKTNEGKIKGVLISPKNIVSHVFSGNIKDGIVIGLSKGNYRIKLVGENFYGKSKITLIGEGDINVYIRDK